ncbi:MAG: acyl-CoA thioesterase II [Deltaproteobacteria bacterium]|nr:acyl-CoA thioesterase II [Myxococcales bacterium]MDP3219999.1 acyl-CoA thioesterase II [Deltaproteobacteria bacterium]
MQRLLSDLVDLLALERLDRDLFRGNSQDLGWGAIFGGQVLGQALSAAAQTVSADRAVHSLHGYFIRAGDLNRPIVYSVDRLRDGKSFSTRRVDAVQEGEAIFSLEASFQVEEEGLEHQDPMPEVPPPEALRSERELALAFADRLPAAFRAIATAERPIEIRPVEPRNPLKPTAVEPRRQLWVRAIDALPDDAALHRYMLAYASDFSFLGTALDPHGVSWLTPGMQVASLDHAMWFHRPFRFDDWLLYSVDSPSASGSRGLVRGRFFDRAGRLVASCAQEGLIRRRK